MTIYIVTQEFFGDPVFIRAFDKEQDAKDWLTEEGFAAKQESYTDESGEKKTFEKWVSTDCNTWGDGVRTIRHEKVGASVD